jgi:2-polyprenyl-6-methoxyphenol hydroxylase-like FAD-dependent oxidoreductase
MAARAQVVIVGGGPVGVGLAIELGQRGISCLLVERRVGLHNIPKGQNLSPRTLEHFWFWGVLDELRAKRIMPKEVPASGVTGYKSLMSEHWFAIPGREITNRYYFQENDRLPQYEMESVLRARMESLPGVSARWGWSARGIAQDAGGVRVTLARDGSGETEVVEADYCVGCDGGHSAVREQIGIERGGSDFEQLMVLAVFRSRELHEIFGRRFPVRSTYRVLTPELKGYWQFFGRIDVGEGWFFHSPIPNDTDRKNYDAHALIEKVVGVPFKAEYDHVGFWDMRIAVAERYQVGRVFIAGDAAHSHPPYGGFGVNNGLEDATNLGWKLAARLQGWGGDALLASYGEERRAIFKETAEDFIAARMAHEASVLDRFSPEKDLEAFKKAWAGMTDDGSARIATYAPHYSGSPVVMGPPGARSSAHGTHTFEAHAGHHLPPQKLSSGRNVYEELGAGFALLAFDGDAGIVAAFQRAAHELGVPLRVVTDTYAGGREAYGARLVLVRPDQFIAWAGDNPPMPPREMLAKAVGR